MVRKLYISYMDYVLNNREKSKLKDIVLSVADNSFIIDHQFVILKYLSCINDSDLSKLSADERNHLSKVIIQELMSIAKDLGLHLFISFRGYPGVYDERGYPAIINFNYSDEIFNKKIWRGEYLNMKEIGYLLDNNILDKLPRLFEIWIKFETSEAKYYVERFSDRSIVFNGKYLLSRPDFMSLNDLIFEHVYNRPNETLSKDQIEKKIGVVINRKLHAIFNDLGFRGQISRLFLNICKDQVEFTPIVSKKMLYNIRIDYDSLEREVRGLKLV